MGLCGEGTVISTSAESTEDGPLNSELAEPPVNQLAAQLSIVAAQVRERGALRPRSTTLPDQIRPGSAPHTCTVEKPCGVQRWSRRRVSVSLLRALASGCYLVTVERLMSAGQSSARLPHQAARLAGLQRQAGQAGRGRDFLPRDK